MYDSLVGTITLISPRMLVLLVHGVGYEICIHERSQRVFLEAASQETCVYVHFVVRENEHMLYGFTTRAERDCYRVLISFPGIGPKTGLAILQMYSVQELLEIVLCEDVVAVAKVPGIGKKTAEKLMVDMKTRLLGTLKEMSLGAPIKESDPVASIREEGLHVLLSLGYSRASANSMLDQALQDASCNVTLEQILPVALRHG